jgi:hypothetical protein
VSLRASKLFSIALERMAGSGCDGEEKKLTSGRDLNGRNTREIQKSAETALIGSAAEILKKELRKQNLK